VFKLGPGGKYTVLHSFTGPDGAEPYSTLVRDASGNLYGTTVLGGADDKGVVFKLDKAGRETVLYSFTGQADGAEPYGGLMRDSAGNLYGTTTYGGVSSDGVVFRLATDGVYTVLHSFSGFDGANPQGGVVEDASGNLYGTALRGGAEYAGVVYKIDSTGVYSIVHTFTAGSDGSDGAFPYDSLIFDPAGNLYGTTASGAFPGCVFKIDTAGTLTILYIFRGPLNGGDGDFPQAGVVRDAAGNLYGATVGGGSYDYGAVFKLDTSLHEAVLFSFPGFPDGGQPAAGLVRDAAGNLYGATFAGGAYSCNYDNSPPGCGTLFEIDASGRETVLYSFSEAVEPTGDLVRDQAGNLYGTTSKGGTSGAGTVFKLDPTGNLTTLYSFNGGVVGGNPQAGLLEDPLGNLYGTALRGGAFNAGVVFKLDSAGNETVLYNFTGGVDGGAPVAALISDTAGNLYGTASSGGTSNAGVVFEVNNDGHETVLHSFAGPDGSKPVGRLLRDTAGDLYGTASGGGAYGAGVVFKIDSGGNYSVLFSFSGRGDGANPQAGLVRDSAGNLYGTTVNGGPSKNGVVFQLDPAGNETVLHSFTGSTGGGSPACTLILDDAGNLYGTTEYGGVFVPVPTGGGSPGGVVFKLAVQDR
jgi:uncharacterized repeat protein (TIGR03803 family)